MAATGGRRAAVVLGLVVLGRAGPARAAEWAVAPGGACDDGGAGSEAQPFCSLGAAAASAVSPGDVVTIHAGVYEEMLVPAADGAPGAPITFRGAVDGDAVLTGSDAEYGIIDVSGRSWITIEGLVVRDTIGWVHAVDADHVTLRDNRFERAEAEGTRGGIKFEGGGFHRVLDNVIDDGNDDVMFIDSDHNLLAGNTITRGRHVLWAIKCGDFNVVRDNFFSNEAQKIGEIYVGAGPAGEKGAAQAAAPPATLTAEVILVATGSSPHRPEFVPFEHIDVDDSDELLQMDRMPGSLAILGAGVIGCEYACMLAALGTKVTLVEGRSYLLPFLGGPARSRHPGLPAAVEPEPSRGPHRRRRRLRRRHGVAAARLAGGGLRARSRVRWVTMPAR
jgi:hypothetical protein